jgi:dTDP-4-dehydro-6-deoxy-alpha-D-glucopyranose 2,3-dehydratase
MQEYSKSFIHSASTRDNHFQDLDDTRSWLRSLRERPDYQVKHIAFSALTQWSFDKDTGNLQHDSGRFFKIIGLHCSPSGKKTDWDQPVILQPETGILGIITREFKGIRYFLMQAKMEPGNINKVQLSPTLQATYSNYTQAHLGKLPPYTGIFLDPAARIITSQLQSETGTRFFRKFNRNIILDVDEDIPVLPGYRWLTLYELQQLMAEDDTVNMDARSVLSNITYALTVNPDGHDTALLRSMNHAAEQAHQPMQALSAWLQTQRASLHIDTEIIPLKSVRNWIQDDWSMRHCRDNYFEIVGVSVEASDREVSRWCQPLLRHQGMGLAGFLCAEINGILHFLLQAKPEPGLVANVEWAPTVSLFDYQHRALLDPQPAYSEYFLQPSARHILHSSIQSEEGGRFWNLRNHYLVIRLPEPIPAEEHYQWLTLAQVQQFSQGQCLVNSEARSLLACLNLFSSYGKTHD